MSNRLRQYKIFARLRKDVVVCYGLAFADVKYYARRLLEYSHDIVRSVCSKG